MAKSITLALLVLGQAIVLLVAGSVTLWWSSNLMLWLIHLVGEERALGASNVIHQEGGGLLLTNPTGMVRWMLPFWLLGSVQILSAVTLVWLWAARQTTTRSEARLTAKSDNDEL